MPEFDVIGIGRAPLDIIYIIDHFPCGDDLIRVQEASIQGGGPVPNALCALSRLGASTALLDTIGDDWQGQKIRAFLEDEGVDTTHVHTMENRRSTVSTILVQRFTGKRAIINHPGDTGEHPLDNDEIQLLKKTRILHITGTYADVVRKAAGIVRTCGGKVSFDGGAGLFKESDRLIIPLVDYCITAFGYAQEYTGKDSIPDMLDSFINCGMEIAGITCGMDGSWFKQKNGKLLHQPAFPVPVVDTTGCGDVYHGVFLYGILQGYPLETTALYASAAGAITAKKLGGRLSAPTMGEIKQLLQEWAN